MTRPYRRGIEGVDERLRQMRFDGASVRELRQIAIRCEQAARDLAVGE